ncbi:MAG TPA: hypothetical protein VE269_05260, partial [Gaiellaceae bacterium]|nr:hypothetical protein [Gaiellaceae bacterium]
TLVGPGGVGKTTLALLVAQAATPVCRGGAAYVDLSTVAEDERIAPAFARGLGIEVHDPDLLLTRLVESLATDELLLVVDNAEVRVAEVGALVHEVATGAVGVRVLITSREPLNISGERLYPVEPLPTAHSGDAGIELFMDRARAQLPSWTPDPGQLPELVEICTRLDGLPLAIELAASQLRLRSLSEVRAALDRGFQSLDRPGVVTRHRGLRAMLDASYAALQPIEAAVFERMSVFAGGFTRATAIEAASDIALPTAVDAALDTLAHKSMFRVSPGEGSTRLSMLETVRAFAHAHLHESGRLEVARRAQAAVIAELVREADAHIAGPAEATWVAVVEDERANAETAVRWWAQRDPSAALALAVSLYFYAFPRGRDDVRGLAAVAVEAIGDDVGIDAELMAAALGVAADHVLAGGDVERAREHYSTAAAGFRHASQPTMAAWLSAAAALPSIHGGDPEHGLAAARAAQTDADETRCPSAMAFARYVVAEGEASLDEAGARAKLEAAVRLAEGVGATYVSGLARLSLATLAIRVGDPAAALSQYSVLLELWRRSGNWAQQWPTLRTLAIALAESGRHEQAMRLLGGIDGNAQVPSWGDDAARLSRVHERARAVLGGDAYATAYGDGVRLSSLDVLALAQRAVRDALAAD